MVQAGTLTITETLVPHPFSPTSNALEIGAINDITATVEWIVVHQTASPGLDWLDTIPGWDYDLINPNGANEWQQNIRGIFTPGTINMSWEDVTGANYNDFYTANGFDTSFATFAALPVLVSLGVTSFNPAGGVGPGETINGFLIEGAFGSPFVAGLSDGRIVSGETNTAIGVTPIPIPGALILLGGGLLALRLRHRLAILSARSF